MGRIYFPHLLILYSSNVYKLLMQMQNTAWRLFDTGLMYIKKCSWCQQ